MNRLQLAEKRLAEALEKLEAATRAAAGRADGGREVLAKERDRLLARVAELEDELAALSSASDEVEGRLDGAIGEIRAALAR